MRNPLAVRVIGPIFELTQHTRWPNAALILAHRLRVTQAQHYIKPTSGQRLVFAETSELVVYRRQILTCKDGPGAERIDKL